MYVLKVNTTYHYTGSSLLPSQTATLTTLPTSPTSPPIFFGRPDTAGILGFISRTTHTHTLTTFSPPAEIATGAPPTLTTCLASSPCTVHAIAFPAADVALVHLAPQANAPAALVQLPLPSLQHLHDFLRHPDAEYMARTTFPPTHVTANTATLTAISPRGTVHTVATDRRFARAAGREPDFGTETAQPVPFLEHTTITKVAAGGLYTAALADDGELFVWGQAVAGTPGELRCLADRGDDDDEFVATVEVGEGARVTEVAVGAAHVLVAAERGGSRGVWAAGDNRYGALGLGVDMEASEFVDEFVAVEGLRGKRVKQMVCGGMSSYVVVETESRGGTKG
ncbi:RCC1/BLIP-II [Karstenula rhodostoma CBS 690.94]|uniref:RCC1/BLIP-II n=1 Tax=Karstenula rhodostoma CBS 690.94 TaxID=1392251 RepID=A0A9P4PLI4_9PLEO|nr:RCC1/BLIP-II [Karstenula rhodostoma CBS 690.94]